MGGCGRGHSEALKAVRRRRGGMQLEAVKVRRTRDAVGLVEQLDERARPAALRLLLEQPRACVPAQGEKNGRHGPRAKRTDVMGFHASGSASVPAPRDALPLGCETGRHAYPTASGNASSQDGANFWCSVFGVTMCFTGPG